MSATALVVTLDSERRLEYRQALEGIGLRVHEADSFRQARATLKQLRPDVLVASLKLGEYNGLHLALIAQAEMPDTRVLIVGDPDIDFEAEVRAVDATYLSEPDPAIVAETVQTQLATAGNRRWTRKPLSQEVRGVLGDAVVRVVDVSYGGFRIEIGVNEARSLTQGFRLQLPEFDVTADAQPVWQVANPDTGVCTCGASVTPIDRRDGSSWRRFVDSMEAGERGS